jgi:tRNA nucleotidyltransferase (CCA-adding enzyme)
VPDDVSAATERLQAARIPAEVIAVAERLQSRGHAAVVVGGAVRDALLGLTATDWDLATSATPSEVQQLFTRTIPTGIDHGTITVLVRRGAGGPSTPVEVTTFRGEGTYADGRRPTHVTFHRDLHEDLARRDFTINAFAWDPVRNVFSDPFGGLADLQTGVVRAVGDPLLRFQEDGLRTMRAVRLCATRELELDPATRVAIGPALPVLDKVSRERVRDELVKLLAAERPSRGLLPMAATGIWDHVLVAMDEPERQRAILACDRIPTSLAGASTVRWARLLWPVARRGAAGRAVVQASVERLRPSRAEKTTLLASTGSHAEALERARTPVEMRRAVAALGRAHLEGVLHVLELSPDHARAIERACEGAALAVDELVVQGRDLIAAGIMSAGPQVGQRLRFLLDRVLVDPSLNEREVLLGLARS